MISNLSSSSVDFALRTTQNQTLCRDQLQSALTGICCPVWPPSCIAQHKSIGYNMHSHARTAPCSKHCEYRPLSSSGWSQFSFPSASSWRCEVLHQAFTLSPVEHVYRRRYHLKHSGSLPDFAVERGA